MFCSKYTMLSTSKGISGFDPLSIPGCALWLDSADAGTISVSGSSVTQWTDKSGGSNATQTTPGNRPTFTGFGVGFNAASSQFMTLNTPYTSSHTIFIVATPTSASQVYLFGRGSGVTGSAPTMIMNYVGTQLEYFPASDGSTRSSYGSPTSTFVACYVRNYGTSVIGTLNGTQVFTSTTPTSEPHPTVAWSHLGQAGIGAGYYTGTIYEFLIYSNALSTTQRQSVEGYLAWKWGINPSLPAIHPFYSIPAFSRAFMPTDINGCSLWLDAGDRSTMNSATTVTSWSDKSGFGNNMTGTATLSGGKMTFNGSTQAFSNTTFVFPSSNYSMFAVYSNTTAPSFVNSYMNVVYGNGGYPMLGIYGNAKNISARAVVANTGALYTTYGGWVASITGSTSMQGYATATDANGNVFVTGSMSSFPNQVKNADGTTGVTLPTSGGAFLAKYSPTGTVLWAVRISDPTTQIATGRGLAVDSSGNVFIVGFYGSALTLYSVGGGTTSLAFTGGTDSFIAKYTTDGGVSWATRLASSAADYAQAIAVDSSGNAYVVGSYSAALTAYSVGGGTTALALTGTTSAFLVKYTSAGVVSWATRNVTSGFCSLYGVATDSGGNVYIVGDYDTGTVTLYNVGTGNTTLTITGTSDAYLARYTSAGAVSWAVKMNSGAGSITDAWGVATDSIGGVFVTGDYDTATLRLYNISGGIGGSLSFEGGRDLFLARYAVSGSLDWAVRGSGTGTDIGYGVATDSGGNVYMTGECGYGNGTTTFYDAADQSNASMTGSSTSNAFLIKYSSAGSVLWLSRIVGGNNVVGYGVSTDTNGNAFVSCSVDTVCRLFNADNTIGGELNGSSQSCVIAKYTSAGYILRFIPASSNVIVSATYTPSTFSPLINGSPQSNVLGTTLAATGIYVGGPSNYFNGSLSELLVYSQTLSASERQQLEGYLAAKWGLLSSVVSGHPFKSIPPSTSQPPQFQEVTPGNWTRDWQPYLQRLAAANSSGVTAAITTTISGASSIYYRGFVLAPNGLLYGVSGGAGNILVFNPVTDTILGTIGFSGGAYYGEGMLAPNGKIYMPGAETNTTILVLTPSSTAPYGTATTIASAGAYNGWGGVLGPNGILYYPTTNNVSTINPDTNAVATITSSSGTSVSGLTLAGNGLIYTTTNSANTMGVIIPSSSSPYGTYSTISGTLGTGYGPGVLAPNGYLYFIGPSILVVFPTGTSATWTTVGSGFTGYSGGVVGADGKIYFSPGGSGNILIVTPLSSSPYATYTTSSAVTGQFFGLKLAPNGNIYGAPNNTTTILKITFSDLSQKPSSNYCLSAWTNKF